MNVSIVVLGYLSSQLDWELGVKSYVAIIKSFEYGDLDGAAELIHDLSGECKSKIIEDFYEIYKRLDSKINQDVKSAVQEFITTYKKVNTLRENILYENEDLSLLRPYLDKALLLDILKYANPTDYRRITKLKRFASFVEKNK